MSSNGETKNPDSHTPHTPKHSSPMLPEQEQQQQRTQSTTSYFTYPVTHVVSGLYRRLTEPPPEPSTRRPSGDPMSSSAVFTPPRRTGSPFQPPPLTPLTLNGSPGSSRQLLSRSLAEEVRLLVPPRLQLLDNWKLVYSLDRDGSSLSTLYEKCKAYSHRSQRSGYVLVVKDSSSLPAVSPEASSGTVFGAYLSDPPHPASHYYGTGECFLWRASTLPGTPMMIPANLNGNASSDHANDNDNHNNNHNTLHPHEALRLAGLPPPPSADTRNLRGRNTTFRGEGLHHQYTSAYRPKEGETADRGHSRFAEENAAKSSAKQDIWSGTSTPERIRFKAFPYSGINDYMIFCETGFLSVGGGDGHYGLWLDNSFEKGVSSSCLTFGNEPLSDEGSKFDVIGVEIWGIGS